VNYKANIQNAVFHFHKSEFQNKLLFYTNTVHRFNHVKLNETQHKFILQLNRIQIPRIVIIVIQIYEIAFCLYISSFLEF